MDLLAVTGSMLICMNQKLNVNFHISTTLATTGRCIFVQNLVSVIISKFYALRIIISSFASNAKTRKLHLGDTYFRADPV